jgi:exodeoxyribonuclease V alpha subunit
MSLLEQALAGRWLRPVDVQAARLLERIDRGHCPELPVAAAFASWATGQGHTCLPLSALPGLLTAAGLDNGGFGDAAALGRRLSASSVVGRPGDFQPLILDENNNLFLLRFHRYEEAIALALRARAAGAEPLDAARIGPLLEALFPAGAETAGVDWQRAAAVLALRRRFVVISGGPGAGKTYTVARILALITALAPDKPRVALAAPTGKAALRLQESIRSAKAALPQQLTANIADQAQTLHRLLGFQADRPGFRRNAANPLHLDLLVLDEASMIDVPLMAALLEALPPSCRIILLGDRDQLASVEAGNLFADLCGNGEIRWSQAQIDQMREFVGPGEFPGASGDQGDPGPLADSLVLLRASHRFREGSSIAALARAVNSGNPERAQATLALQFPDLHVADAAAPGSASWLHDRIEPFLLPILAAASPQAALRELGRRRILCALREGPSGVEGLNRLAETLFRRAGRIPQAARLYPGMPIIILRNDYALSLFNGDAGVLWPDDRGSLQAWFEQENGTARAVGLSRLPAWQTSYAITVHKSQGSEFAEVLLILPPEDAPVLSRELLYTGITRARNALTLTCRRETLLRVVQRRIVRHSGLGAKLRAPDPSFPSESRKE